MAQVKAPWSTWQVESLEAYQQAGVMHPYTCGCGRGHDPERPHPPHTSLVPTRLGWTCPHCDYTQDWAHDFAANWSWIMCHAGSGDLLLFAPIAALREQNAKLREALRLACAALVDVHGDCPGDRHDWDHPDTCEKHCDTGPVEALCIGCYATYFEQQAALAEAPDA